VRAGLSITIMATFTLVALIAPMALEWESFSCSPDGRCTVSHRVVPWSDRSLARSALRGARVEQASGSDGAGIGRVLLSVEPGPQVRSMEVSTGTATDAVATIDAAIRDGRPFEVTLHAWGSLGLWLAALAGMVVCTVQAMRERALLRLELVRGGETLRVGRPLGVTSDAGELALEEVMDVVVEVGSPARSLHDFDREDDPMVAARIVLLDRAGAPRPLTSRFLLGHAVHLRAAVALRALLELPPRQGGPEDQLAALAPTPMPTGVRTMFMLFGLAVGFSVGFLVFVVPALYAGGMDALPSSLHYVVGLGIMGCVGAALILAAKWTRPRLR
jgi:hypothetical protein